MTPGRFAGRGVLVTGSTGMGGAGALALAAEGASVLVVARDTGRLAELAATAAAGGDGIATFAADLRDEAAVEAAFAAFDGRIGRLDAVYGVAGISGRRFGDGPLDEATLEGWETVLRSNATAQFLVARAAVRRMLAQERDGLWGRGSVLLMSTQLARHPAPQHFATHAYAASKGAIEALVRAAAATYAADGIRVNAIAPSLVATPMSRRAQTDAAVLGYLAEKQPLAAGPIPTDGVTPVALHLLSPEARMVTGQVVGVDAGWSVSEPRAGG